MEAFQTSSDEGRRVTIESRVERPAMMPAGLVTGQTRLSEADQEERQCAKP